MSETLLAKASFLDVLRGRARLVGSRCDERQTRGWISPIEAQVLMGIPYGDLVEREKQYLRRPRSLTSDAGVVLKVALAHLLTPPPTTSCTGRSKIVSAVVDNLSISDALAMIFEEPRERARIIHFVHAHALNLATADTHYASLLARANLVLPDGIGIRLAARILGVAMQHNLNGTDMVPLLCKEAARRGIPMCLVGGESCVIEETARRLSQHFPSLNITIATHRYLDSAQSKKLSQTLTGLGPCVVLVGMGSPIQERWVWRHLSHLPQVTVLTVGGIFDFVSGRFRRAPIGWRELGLEWVYRMVQEPRRLGRRYLMGNPLFIARAVHQRMKGDALL